MASVMDNMSESLKTDEVDGINVTESPASTTVNTHQSLFFAVLQWSIVIVGTLGNLLVIVVLLWNRSRAQLVTQLFVGSLSLADL